MLHKVVQHEFKNLVEHLTTNQVIWQEDSVLIGYEKRETV